MEARVDMTRRRLLQFLGVALVAPKNLLPRAAAAGAPAVPIGVPFVEFKTAGGVWKPLGTLHQASMEKAFTALVGGIEARLEPQIHGPSKWTMDGILNVNPLDDHLWREVVADVRVRMFGEDGVNVEWEIDRARLVAGVDGSPEVRFRADGDDHFGVLHMTDPSSGPVERGALIVDDAGPIGYAIEDAAAGEPVAVKVKAV